MSWPVRRPSCRESQAPCLVVAAWPPAGPKVVQKGAPKGQQVGNGWATRERRRGGLPGTRRVRRGIYNGTDSGPKVATCCPFLYIIAGLYVLLRVMQYYYCRGAMLVRRGPGMGPEGGPEKKAPFFIKKGPGVRQWISCPVWMTASSDGRKSSAPLWSMGTPAPVRR